MDSHGLLLSTSLSNGLNSTASPCCLRQACTKCRCSLAVEHVSRWCTWSQQRPRVQYLQRVTRPAFSSQEEGSRHSSVVRVQGARTHTEPLQCNTGRRRRPHQWICASISAAHRGCDRFKLVAAQADAPTAASLSSYQQCCICIIALTRWCDGRAVKSADVRSALCDCCKLLKGIAHIRLCSAGKKQLVLGDRLVDQRCTEPASAGVNMTTLGQQERELHTQFCARL